MADRAIERWRSRIEHLEQREADAYHRASLLDQQIAAMQTKERTAEVVQIILDLCRDNLLPEQLRAAGVRITEEEQADASYDA